VGRTPSRVAVIQSTAGGLDGMRVVVTRSADQADHLVRGLTELGARVLALPTIQIVDPDSWDGLDRALEDLSNGGYEWVLFASANAVRKVVARAGGVEPLLGTRIAAIGSSTGAELTANGLPPELVPDRFEGAALGRKLGSGNGRILLPRVAAGPRSLVDAVSRLGWEVDEVDVYRNVPARPDPDVVRRLLRGDFDVVTFTSPSTVRNFTRIAPPSRLGLDPRSDEKRKVACIGPSTADAARALGVRVDVVASEHTADGLVQAVRSLKGATIDK
jgi:uroporphyrinogen-III synthase